MRTPSRSSVALLLLATPHLAQGAQVAGPVLAAPKPCLTIDFANAERIFDYSEDAIDPPDCVPPFGSANFVDGPARALRFDDGAGGTRVQVHIPMSGEPGCTDGNYRMTGSDFDSLVVDPVPILDSNHDASPCNFNDEAWLMSVYKEGDVVHGLVHDEYRAAKHTSADIPVPVCGSCLHMSNCCGGLPNGSLPCTWTTLTAARSFDDGATFLQRDDFVPGATPDLVASAPWQYRVGGALGAYRGIYEPTNILKHPTDGHYYVIAAQHLPSIHVDTCGTPWFEVEQSILMRTADLSNPMGWRAWRGTFDAAGEPVFDVRLFDPYPVEPDPCVRTGYPLDPTWHLWGETCGSPGTGPVPTAANFRGGLLWSTFLQRFVLTGDGIACDGAGNVVRTPAITTSTDLVHWEPAQLVDPTLTVGIHGAQWSDPMYPTLIDHDSPSDSFDVIDDTCHLYYRLPDENGKGDLWRVPIHLACP